LKIAALDIGGTAIKYYLYNNQYDLIKDHVFETPTNAHLGGKALMEKVRTILNSMGEFDAIAISSAGQVDPVAGSIIYATDNIPQYTGTQIKKNLEELFHVPVVVENDVNAAALGEATSGAGKNYDSFLCLTYGTGIGGAIIINHQIYHGNSFCAGEMGHIITHAGGLKCTCGNCGCYESYASTTALIRTVKEHTGLNLNGREIFEVIDTDSRVKEGVTAWIDEVIWGLVSLIYIFNPPAIILGGGIMNEEFIRNTIQQNIGNHLMQSYRQIQIRKAVLGNTAGLQGMIHLAKIQMEKRGNMDHVI